MKKIKFLTLAMAMLLGVGNVCAQTDNTFCFLDANGNEVKDGSTVTFYAEQEMIDLGFMVIPGALQAKFNLSVKNTTNADASVAIRVITQSMPNGSLTVCFPKQCVDKAPNNFISAGDIMLANESRPLSSEWLPDANQYAEADFTVQLLKSEKGSSLDNVNAFGPTVKIHCIYADPTGIADMEADKNATVVARYDSKGNRLSAPAKGLNIIKLSNGKTVKTIIK